MSLSASLISTSAFPNYAVRNLEFLFFSAQFTARGVKLSNRLGPLDSPEGEPSRTVNGVQI